MYHLILQRPEIVEWVNQGGGEVVNDSFMKNRDFTIECHGLFRSAAGTTQTTYVSSHWVRSCLEVSFFLLLLSTGYTIYAMEYCL